VKSLKSKLLPPLSVKSLLLSRVGGPEDRRSVGELHASELTNQDPEFCPREVALLRALGMTRPDFHVPHALRVTFDEGRDKQWRINNEYLRPYMVGAWECVRCGDYRPWGKAPPIENCDSVRGHLWEYVEPVFKHPSGFTGSIDGVVRFTSARLRPIEVKIMKGDDYEKLKAPLAEHRVRTQLYLRLIAESVDQYTAEIDASAAHVIYIMRGHGKKDEAGVITPFKEYVVPRNDKAVERYVRMAYAVGKGMPSGICASALCKRAEKCAVAKECFSGKHPVTNHWEKGIT
jgi:hypothetical protein